MTLRHRLHRIALALAAACALGLLYPTSATAQPVVEAKGAKITDATAGLPYVITPKALATVTLDPINWRGAWSAGTDYAQGDGVSYSGSSYVAGGNPSTGDVPGVDADWTLIAAKGDTGATGAAGATGATGAAGSNGADGADGLGYAATSTTSLAIGTGSKTATISPVATAYAVGLHARLTNAADPLEWMEGNITAYNSGSGSLTINVTETYGAGTVADWVVSLGTPLPDAVAIAEVSTASFVLTEGEAPSTPTAGTVALYAKSDGLVYAKDDGGTESSLAAASAEAYDATAWDGNTSGAQKNDIRDKIESLAFSDLDGTVGDTQVAAGAIDGGTGGEIADASITAADLATDSVSADELNAGGVEAELEAVMDLQDMQGAVTDAQVPDTITIGGGLIDASGFNGNLATTDNTVQEVAQKVDDLVLGSGGNAFGPFATMTVGYAVVTGSGTTVSVVGVNNTVSGTASGVAVSSTMPASHDIATAATTGSDAGWASANDATHFARQPKLAAIAHLQSTTNVRAWIGLTDGLSSTRNGSDPVDNVAAFRFDTGAGDTNWMAVTNDDNSTGTITDTGVAGSTAGVFLVEVGASSVVFSINGTVVATHSTNLPGSAVGVYIASVRTLANEAKTIRLSSVALKK